MEYTNKDIEKIVGFKSWSNDRKYNTLLEIDCIQYCNMGIDSTKAEKQHVRSMSRKIYTAIKKFNPSAGETFLRSMDLKNK
jgi:hypothetical protein|tara:strand:+ start:4945 stop:5187 length:243 start_codon:yes stop_codon:yes gene_type:complete